MEFKQIVRDTAQYPGSPYLTMSRFQGQDTGTRSMSAKDEELLLIFDVSFLEENETFLSFPEPQLLQVSFKHGFKNAGRLSCRRDCVYTFRFSEDVKVEDLIAQWTADDFLVIREKTPVDFKNPDEFTKRKSAGAKKPDQPTKEIPAEGEKPNEPTKEIPAEGEKPNEPTKEISAEGEKPDELTKKIPAEAKTPDEPTEEIPADDEKPNVPGEKIPAKAEKSDGSGKEISVESDNKEQVTLEQNKLEISNLSSKIGADTENSDQSSSTNTDNMKVVNSFKDSEKTEGDFENCAKPQNVPRLIPQKVDKIYKPNLSVIKLRSVMSDIENRILLVKNFIDNHSFETPIEQSAGALETKSLQSE